MALGTSREYRFKNFNELNNRRKKADKAEEIRLKREQNADYDEMVKREEQAESISVKQAKANKKRAKNLAMVAQMENIDIEKGLDLDVFMGNKYK